MALRDEIRKLRLYMNSGALFRAHLASPSMAWWLPFLPADRGVNVSMASGRSFSMKASCWPLLPSACRLESIGARFQFLDDAKRIDIDGLTLYSPLWSREEASYYKEVLLDDVYQIKSRDMSGATVVDVGAYVGDSSIAFARQGASVHACEPSVAFCNFIRRNLEANSLAQSVRLHPVGLAERTEDVPIRNDALRMVEGVGYVLDHLPQRIDLLKLDCEGSEYYLLADPRFLSHLSPREIRMEYHRGKEPVVTYLLQAGYSVDAMSGSGPVGLISARRRES
jgi:hypothetical protein